MKHVLAKETISCHFLSHFRIGKSWYMDKIRTLKKINHCCFVHSLSPNCAAGLRLSVHLRQGHCKYQLLLISPLS